MHKHSETRKNTTRQQRELEAEATSYVVLSHFGVQHGSAFYLATYEVTPEMLTDSLATISGAAKRIIDLIERDATGAGEENCAEVVAT